MPVRKLGIEIVTAEFVARMHALGKQVHVWTVDDAPLMEWLLEQGVDGIFTDRVDTLKDVLTAHGRWT